MNDSNDSDEDNDGNKEESAVDDDEDKVQENNDEDLHGFLSMFGSLKDWAAGFLVPTSALFSVKSNVCSLINTYMDSFFFFFLFGIG
jgi:hypothetical protein